MVEHKKDQRHFSRIPFDCDAVIKVDGNQWTTQLLDVCLNGVLLIRPRNWQPNIGTECQVTLILHEEDVLINMDQASVAHCHVDRVGLQCMIIDIDSISHLRRLVELNLGDPELVNRELAQLGWSDEIN